VGGDFKLAARHFLDLAGKGIGATEQGVERLGEARGQTPTHGGLGVHGRGNACSQNTGDTGVFQNGTTIHG